MRILLIEDQEVRIAWFKKKFKDHTLIIAKSRQEAEEIFEMGMPYHMAFLDHDLEEINPTPDKTTSALIKQNERVREVLNNLLDGVIIHSINYDGAQNIKSLLPKAQVIQYHKLQVLTGG